MEKSLWILGDSVSKGILYDDRRERHCLIARSPAQQVAEQLHMPLHNHSAMGATLERAALVLAREAPSAGDVVVIGYGGNDCDFQWAEVADRPDEAHACKTPLNDFLEMYRQLIVRLRAAGAVPVVMTLPPLDAARYFAWISRGLDADAILHWLGDVQQIYRWQELYSHCVASLARQMDCPLLDIRESFLLQRNMPHLLCMDGIHPNEQGYQLIAQSAMAAAVRQGLLPAS